MSHWMRRLHKWVGLVLAIQFLLDAVAETMMPIAADDDRAMEHI